MIPKIPHNFYHRVFFPLLELYQIVIFILSYFLQRQLVPETNLHIFPLLQFLHLYHFVWVAQFWRYWQYNETNWHLPCGARSAKKINKYMSCSDVYFKRKKKTVSVTDCSSQRFTKIWAVFGWNYIFFCTTTLAKGITAEGSKHLFSENKLMLMSVW